MKKVMLFSMIAFLFVWAPAARAQTFPADVQAQMDDHTLWYNYAPGLFINKVFGSPPNEIFGERYTLAQVNWIVNSLNYQGYGKLLGCLGSGTTDPATIRTCVPSTTPAAGGGPATPTVNLSSPILFLAQVSESFYNNRPASGIDYVAMKVNDLNPQKGVYAQTGYGYSTLRPLLNIWTAMRNVAFALMSFVIIIMAFMIMLRRKISPQAVVTVQSALPKIAIALVVITFSYAIAGFMIDLSYVVMGVFSAILSVSGLTQGTNPIDIFNLLNAPMKGLTGWVTILIIMIAIVGGAFATIFGAVVPVVGAVGSLAVSGVILLILGILFAVAFFRVFVAMVKAYATSVFLVIGFPLVALASVVSVGPGIGGWVRQFAAQLAVFVGIGFAVALSHMVFWSMSTGLTATFGSSIQAANPYGFITGQVQGSPQFPGFGGFGIDIIGFIVGFGVLFSAPKIANGLRDQIATGRGSYGFDTTGTMLGPAAGLIGYGKGVAKSQGTEFMAAQLAARGGFKGILNSIRGGGNASDISQSQANGTALPTNAPSTPVSSSAERQSGTRKR